MLGTMPNIPAGYHADLLSGRPARRVGSGQVGSGRDISAQPSGLNRHIGRARPSRAGSSYAVRVGSCQVGLGRATLVGSGQFDSDWMKPGRLRPDRVGLGRVKLRSSGRVESSQTCTRAEMSRLTPTRPGPTRLGAT